MPEQKAQQEINQEIRTSKEALSGPAPADIDRKRKQEAPLFEKIEDALGIDDSTFETNLLPSERD
ncbi:MAG: hypothetical protein K0R55_3877 [Sporomusa sp.]|jgi:hypothetical protein|nr:hypothetical protein [Sporomusa sp.]